ncbi:MAG: hypothetical protein O7C75_21380 [Verrucomicrobia bacterium]|nr:hypothetical protein [Verrucomicrobiota bacterium]
MKTLKLAIFGFSLTTFCVGAEFQAYGPPVDSDIKAIYVPPTRSDEPIVATDKVLFQYDKSEKNWEKLYSPPWQDSSLLGVSGYAKSSQMLYVVHSQGIAASRDAGENWTESIPPGFGTESGALRSLAVDPENRKEAIFVFENACWLTGDYGLNFEIILPGEQFVGGAYAPSEAGTSHTRIVATTNAIHLDTTSGFISITPPKNQTLNRLTVHPNKDMAYLSCKDNQMLLLNILSQRGTLINLNSSAPTHTVSSSESSLWILDNGSLSILNFKDLSNSQNYQLTTLPTGGNVIFPHPRKPDALYYSQGSQLHLLTDAFNNLPSQILASVDQQSFIPLRRSVQNLEKNRVETQSADNFALSALIASEPPLTSVIAAAVAYNLENPETLADWKRKARSRNWLPKLRIASYARQSPLDVTRLDTYTDRFGIEQTEDIRLSDEIRTFNRSALFLEWDLKMLFFHEDQVDVVRERRYQAQHRRVLATEITKLYYERIEIIAGLKGISNSKSLSRDKLYLALREVTDLLNTLCGQELFKHTEM